MRVEPLPFGALTHIWTPGLGDAGGHPRLPAERPRSRFQWSTEREEYLERLWADGYSGAEIAARLGGVTRNAVIGKVHRLGLPGRKARMRSPRRKKKHGSLPATPRRFRWWKAPSRHPVAALTEAERLALLSQAPAPLLIGVLALRDGMCRWPVGDPKQPDFGFCGHEQEPGVSYCRLHARVAFILLGPTKPRSR